MSETWFILMVSYDLTKFFELLKNFSQRRFVADFLPRQ
jgi:hypothetical protein